LEAGDETRGGRDAAPAIQVPAGAKVFDIEAKRDVENHFGGAVVELLGEFEEREFAKVLAIGRAPDGNVEGFLLDLVGNGEDAEEGAGFGARDFDGFADGIGFECGVGGDEREFEGHGEFPFQSEMSLTQGKSGPSKLGP